MSLTAHLVTSVAARYGLKLVGKMLEDKKEPLPADLKTLKLPDLARLSGDEKRVVAYLHALQDWHQRYELEDDYHRARETEPADMQASLEAVREWLRVNPKPKLTDF